MQTLKVLVFSSVLAIGSSVLLSQEIQIKSGNFVMKCRATEALRANPDFLSLYETVVAGLKTAVESNGISLTKNVDVQGDIKKLASSGKILNGIMMYAGISGAEISTLQGTFFPCKDAAQSAQEYQETIYADYFKMLTEKIKTINK